LTFTSKNVGTKFNSVHQEVHQDWLSNHAGEFPVELFRNNIVEDISAAIEKFKTEKCALEILALNILINMSLLGCLVLIRNRTHIVHCLKIPTK
jgi:hypothetical protein